MQGMRLVGADGRALARSRSLLQQECEPTSVTCCPANLEDSCGCETFDVATYNALRGAKVSTSHASPVPYPTFKPQVLAIGAPAIHGVGYTRMRLPTSAARQLSWQRSAVQTAATGRPVGLRARSLGNIPRRRPVCRRATPSAQSSAPQTRAWSPCGPLRSLRRACARAAAGSPPHGTACQIWSERRAP